MAAGASFCTRPAARTSGSAMRSHRQQRGPERAA